MFPSVEAVIHSLEAAALAPAVDVVVPLVRPAVALVPAGDPFEEWVPGDPEIDELPVGTSKLAGLPDAFEGFIWPTNGFPAMEQPEAGWYAGPRYWAQQFLAQLAVDDLASFELPFGLPDDGHLLFFVGNQDVTVLHLPAWVPRVRAPLPDMDLFDLGPGRATAVAMEQIYTVPAAHSAELRSRERFPWLDTYHEWWWEAVEGNRNWVGGHPYYWQEDPRIHAERSSLGRHWRRDLSDLEIAAAAADDWELLLQVEEPSAGGTTWWLRPPQSPPDSFLGCVGETCY